MQFTPYLSFNGRCKEAMEFYAQLFDGEIIAIQTFGESPIPKEMCQGREDKIIHARLQIGNQLLMASDLPDEHYNKAQGMDIAINLDSPEEAERIFAALAEGGEIIMPIEKTFWAQKFGVVTDRFDTPWMINCE